jgi:filamentous hemagglutinin family protein
MTNDMSPICNARTGAIGIGFKIKIVMHAWYRNSLFQQMVAIAFALGATLNALANPTGMTVQSGSATTVTSGSQLTITTGNSALLNWQSFNIAAGETTIFNQPSTYSVVVNRITDQNPSQIYGSLQANGRVVLLNASGFYFGPNSFIKTGGLIVSTANCIPPQNSGGSWEFNGPPPLASIINYGQIQVGNGGPAFLIADKIENHGDIEAPGGSIGLAAGQTVLLSDRPDGRGMSMQVTLPSGSVDNEGRLIADGGTIAMRAQVVNQNGFIQANSVQNRNGVIELVASDQLNLGASSQIIASGDDTPAGSAGGDVTLKSENSFSDSVGSQITVTGGTQGGNGGNVEISAPNVRSLNSSINARAQAGWTAGKLLLDPDYIILDTSGSDSAGSGTVLAGSNPGGTLDLNVNSAFANLAVSQIILQVAYDITLAGGTSWNLSQTIGANFGGVSSGLLTLEAGRNIILGGGSQITDANDWSVVLEAGYNFVNNAVQSGQGNIYLNGGSGMTAGSSIQTAAGNISLIAGQDILVDANQSPNSGFVRTTGGGNVSAWALAGDVNTGTYAHGYVFNSANSLDSTYYKIDPFNGVGGISTEAGGNVTITAGGDVTSYLPYGNSVATIGGDAGSGAFGPQAGDVTIVAGGNVTGHYVVANGTGGIYAGVEMDANGNPVKDVSGHYVLNSSSTGSAGTADNKLALSLIAGGWTVDAAQDICLQEVRNPNGILNSSGGMNKPTFHYFDYAPDAYVNLSAGNSVQLGDSSSSLPRKSDGVHVPFIYAPILNIVAGAGGVVLTGDSGSYGKLILFPSPQGSLTITTTGGGSLTGSLPPNSDGSPAIFNLVVSDSAQTQFYDNLDIFGLTDHAATPVHLNSPTPIVLNISGDMNSVLLGAPEAAQITVGGNMINSRFQGMNLSSDSSQSVQVPVREIDGSLGTATVHPGVSSINVAGDILNRGEFTTITLPAGAPVPDIALLAQAIDPSDVTLAANLARELFYNPATGQLTIQGAVTTDVLNLLQNLTYQVYVNGQPQFISDGNGGLTPEIATINLLDPATTPGEAGATAQTLIAQYASLGPIPTSRDSGYILGGGGQFNIAAHNMDLGTTLGIQSQGIAFDIATVDNNGDSTTVYPLAQYFTRGADINVNLSGNLDMFSASIASLNNGSISINAGGDVNAGSSVFTVNSESARGIFTAAQGDVSVIAGGDINVNGSRIVAYDGGNVTVESLNGNINAGTGASLPVTVNAYYEDPITHAVYSTSPQLPFSGIMALTLPARDASYPAPTATLGNILVEAPNGDITANVAGILQVPLNDLNYPDATTTVLAGYELRNSMGNPVTAGNMADGTPALVSADRNINASGSGIIASNAKLDASGSIIGLIFARNNIDINAQQNVNVTALGGENVNVSSSGGTISGTIIGVGGVNVSGNSIDASLISANVSGATSGQSGLGQGTAANATSQAASGENSNLAAASSDDTDDKKKKKGTEVALAQKTGQVTVLLPSKNRT